MSYIPINNSSNLLILWSSIQEKWLMIRSVFSNDEVKLQLPRETNLHLELSKIWLSSMELFKESDFNVMNVTMSPGLLEELEKAKNLTGTIIEVLQRYAVEIRIAFPR